MNDPSPLDTVRGEFFYSLLGYAAVPNDDGSCPRFQDSYGRPRSTYVLRRFLPINMGKTPVYQLDKVGAGLPNPVGYFEDRKFKACTPSPDT
jgi:hypothetical protein